VLRVVRDATNPIDRGFERRLLQGPIARLTAPLIAFALPQGHMLTRRVPGPLLIDAAASLDDVARYAAALHRKIPALHRRYDVVARIGRDLAAAAHAGEAAPAWIHAIHAQLSSTGLNSSPCHNDLNPWNVIVSAQDPARWCTIDWEFAGENDPLFDALCLAHGLGLDATQSDELIDAYLSASKSSRVPTAAQRRTLEATYFLREYAWALEQRARGNHRHEILAQIERSAEALRRFSR
jgi:thiamine kinase-like enzyme